MMPFLLVGSAAALALLVAAVVAVSVLSFLVVCVRLVLVAHAAAAIRRAWPRAAARARWSNALRRWWS
jgi:hypothetical protein